tara:strand:- start:136 stop:426 length:291 start_codon:yes stop_codon:yes gene_type:complete
MTELIENSIEHSQAHKAIQMARAYADAVFYASQKQGPAGDYLANARHAAAQKPTNKNLLRLCELYSVAAVSGQLSASSKAEMEELENGFKAGILSL